MSTKETLDRAYGNIPKEVTPYTDLFDWVPTRTVKYVWLKWIVRKFFR